ncbi:MAG: hypothetical protein SO164_05300 [Campylobacter sp.]|nr:hypothetical protein [Campylobacter sp.]
MMAHSYSHLFNLPATELRFFLFMGPRVVLIWRYLNLLRLLEYIAAIERELGKEIKKNMLPMQAGDVAATHADASALELLGYKPKISIDEGVANFIAWYKSYFKIKAQG